MESLAHSMQEHEEVPLVAIVGAFDVHRAQLTYDYVSTETGEVRRGQVRPVDREHLQAWLARGRGGRARGGAAG